MGFFVVATVVIVCMSLAFYLNGVRDEYVTRDMEQNATDYIAELITQKSIGLIVITLALNRSKCDRARERVCGRTRVSERFVSGM